MFNQIIACVCAAETLLNAQILKEPINMIFPTYFDLLQSHFSFCLLVLFISSLKRSFQISSKHTVVTLTQNCWLDFYLISTLVSDQDIAVSPHPPGDPRTIRGDARQQSRPLIGWCSLPLASNWSSEVARRLRTGYWSWPGHVTCSWLLASVEAALDWPSPTPHWADRRCFTALVGLPAGDFDEWRSLTPLGKRRFDVCGPQPWQRRQ